MVNVLTYACNIPINDGNTHMVGNAPSGSCFKGITTLAGLAAITIDGTTPFSFLTDSGSVTGPLCNVASTTNCFTSSAGAYQLTNAKVTRIDIAWLAIQAALLTKNAYIPSVLASAANNTGYEVGTSLPLPLMIPLATEGDANNLTLGEHIMGDGPRKSVIFAGSSFGYASDGKTILPLMSCGDPGATPAGQTGRWNPSAECSGFLEKIGFWGSQSLAQGLSSTYHTDGLALGARLATTDVYSSWFYHDISIVGDHSLYIRTHTNNGVYGLYFPPPNSGLLGDLQFIDFAASGASFAAVDVDGAASMNGFFEGETYLNGGLYAIYGENNGCQPIVGGALIRNLMTEYGSLGVIEDGHNWNGSTYNDSAKCRGVLDMNTDHWFNSYNNPNITGGTGSGRRRRATIDASFINGKLHGISADAGNLIPVADNIGAAGIAVFNVNGISDAATGLGLELEGSMLNTFAAGVGAGPSGATIPIFPVTANAGPGSPGLETTWKDPGGDSGVFLKWLAEGNYTTTTVGDVFEALAGTVDQVVPGGYSEAAPVAGVAAQAGLTTGTVVPLQNHGTVFITANNHFGNNGYQKKSTGIGKLSFVGGSGGTTGNYMITASSGCATEPQVTAVVSGGAITSVTTPNVQTQYECTAIPVFSTSSIIGLTGGSITAQWPSAGEVAANPTDGATIFSYGLHASTGSLSTGTLTSYSRLIGLQ